MAADEADRLAKAIVAAYRASGISARVYRGCVFVRRDEEWDGPLDPLRLRQTYRDEIACVECAVRQVVAQCFARSRDVPQGALSPLCGEFYEALPIERKRALWLTFGITESEFVQAGMSELKARLYVSVARMLEFRNELWC